MSLGTLTREAGVCKKSSHAAVKSIAKPRDYPYEEVHVLLLQWEKSDNLGTTKHGHTDQVRELMRVLVESIHVTTCLWKAICSEALMIIAIHKYIAIFMKFGKIMGISLVL